MGKLLDYRGRPIDTAALDEPQTAHLGHLQREFANHPVRGLTPAKLQRILVAAEQGDIMAQHELFADLEERDGHILAELSKRKRALLTVEWSIEPPRNASAAEKDDAAWLKEKIEDLDNLEDILLDVLDAIGHGFSCSEITWDLVGNERLPASIELRPPTWFQINQEHQNELRLRDNSAYGAALNPFGWITHVHKAKSGYIARAGLHRVLAWTYIFKSYSARDFAELLEIFGIPLRIGKYPSGSDDDAKRTLLQAVTQLGHAAAGIMPSEMAIELVQSTGGGGGAPHMTMIDWCERTQSKVILGGTLTSQADGKSSTNALGNVHNEVRHDLLVADARQLESTLKRDLVYAILAVNGRVKDPRRIPRIEFDVAVAEDVAMFADALPKLIAVGAQIPVDYVNDKLKIPKPEAGAPVLGTKAAPAPAPNVPPGAPPGTPPAPGPAAPPAPGPADPANSATPPQDPATPSGARALLAALTAALAQAPAPDALDQAAALALADWEPTLTHALAPLHAALTEAAAAGLSLAEFRDQLPALLGKTDITLLNEQLARAVFLARLAGEAGIDL